MSEPPYILSADFPRLVEAVQRAPSVFNTRPWWFDPRPPCHVDLWLLPDRGEYDGAGSRLEFNGAARARARERGSAARARERGSAAQAHVPHAAGRPRRRDCLARARAREYVISCGAALFNLRLAIRMAGHPLTVWTLPDPEYLDPMAPPTLLASVEIMQGRVDKPGTEVQELYEAIWRRHTSRWPYPILPAPLPIIVAMENAALREGAYLRLLDPHQARKCLQLVAEADRDPAFKPPFPNFVSHANYGPTPEDGYPVTRKDFWLHGVKRRFERKPQLLALSTDDDEPVDWLRAGQALQHAILTGTRYSVSAPYGLAARYDSSYRYGLPTRHHLLKPDESAKYGLSASFLTQALEHDDLEGRGRRWPLPWYYPELPQMLVRVGYAADQALGEVPPKTEMAAGRSRPPWHPPRRSLPNSGSELRTGA